jgi:hypothetical protein
MTAPNNTDEEKLRHFSSVKPRHTGLVMAPGYRRETWWFSSEDTLGAIFGRHP